MSRNDNLHVFSVSIALINGKTCQLKTTNRLVFFYVTIYRQYRQPRRILRSFAVRGWT